MPPKKTCGNPLFLSWVEELRDSAREKGSKSFETFSKACRSLSACPVTYPRPRDLVVLQGIGPKTASVLETRYLKYCQENGLPLPGSPEKPKTKSRARAAPTDPDAEDDEDSTNSAPPPPPKKRKPSAPRAPKAYIPQRGSGGYGILLALVLAIDDPLRNTQVFLTKGEVIRSGQPYSDASYEHSEKGTYFTAWSSMKTLVNKGYVYVTGNPHKYCLTEEGYEVACAIRSLRPEFAHIERHPFLHEPAPDIPWAGLPPSRLPPASVSTNGDSGPSSHRVHAPVAARPDLSVRSEKFRFWYINSVGSRVETMSSAVIRLDPDDFVNLRKVEFRAEQRSHAFAKQLNLVDAIATVRDSSGRATLFGFILEEGAPPTCSKFDDVGQDEMRVGEVVQRGVGPTTQNGVGSRQRLHEPMILDDDDGDDNDNNDNGDSMPTMTTNQHHSPLKSLFTSDLVSPAASPLARTTSAPFPSTRPEDTGEMRSLAAQAAARRSGPTSAGPSRAQSAAADLPLPSKPSRPAPRLSSHIPAPTPLLDPSDQPAEPANLPNFDPSDAIIFPRGSYEIVLVVDTREVESKSNRDKIAEALEAKGVRVETRALRLGDMCWIARRLDGLGGEEDECVLDYVAERKRLDDLCISIKDGRYSEQCFRLSNSCIKHIYYIVEDWQVAERMTYDGLQIMTAKSQIQVHNRFFLKETHKLSETIDFLATMTDVIIERHLRSDLRVIPTRFLSRSSYAALQAHLGKTRPGERYLTSFQAYQELNDKNASKTLREKFARMLLCVKGMSAERVSAVLDVWETPRAMWDGLKRRLEEDESGDGDQEETLRNEESQGRSTPTGNAETAKKKAKKSKGKVRGPDLFFADVVQGEGRRKIGDALSKELYKVLMGGEATA